MLFYKLTVTILLKSCCLNTSSQQEPNRNKLNISTLQKNINRLSSSIQQQPAGITGCWFLLVAAG